MRRDQGTMNPYDAIIIGAGQSGKPLALTLATAGWRTALIERDHVGGTCINYGCTPSKTMVASARVAYLSRRGSDYGVTTESVGIDMARVIARKRAVIQSFREGSERRIREQENLDFLHGSAGFVDANTVRVKLNEGQTIEIRGKKIFINTGGRPALPKLPGLNEIPWLDSTTIMELERVPEHLLVLGGGYVGVEFSQMFRRLGSRVTILQRAGQLLPREDSDVAAEVASILREDGIEIFLNTEAIHARKKDGFISLTARTQSGDRWFTGSHLLVALGRVPNIERLNLPEAGVATGENGTIQVNEFLETTVPGVFAMGDVKGGPAFTHVSYDDFRVLKSNLLEGRRASVRGRLVPYTVFIDPQLGRVGITEKEALKQNLHFRVAKMPMSQVARALEIDESRGVIKALVDLADGRILGCAVLGIEAGEIMSLIQIAMMGHLTETQLRDAVFAHPTLAESLNNLF